MKFVYSANQAGIICLKSWIQKRWPKFCKMTEFQLHAALWALGTSTQTWSPSLLALVLLYSPQLRENEGQAKNGQAELVANVKSFLTLLQVLKMQGFRWSCKDQGVSAMQFSTPAPSFCSKSSCRVLCTRRQQNLESDVPVSGESDSTLHLSIALKYFLCPHANKEQCFKTFLN